jgi:hypothetical protein
MIPPSELLAGDDVLLWCLVDSLNSVLHALSAEGVIGDLLSSEADAIRARFWAEMGSSDYAPPRLQSWALAVRMSQRCDGERER